MIRCFMCHVEWTVQGALTIELHAPAPTVTEIALTKSSEIFPALRIPHLMGDPNDAIDPDKDIWYWIYWLVLGKVKDGFSFIEVWSLEVGISEWKRKMHALWKEQNRSKRHNWTRQGVIRFTPWVTPSKQPTCTVVCIINTCIDRANTRYLILS